MKNLKLHKSWLKSIDELKNASSALIVNSTDICYSDNRAIWRKQLDPNRPSELVVDLSTEVIYVDQDVKVTSYTYNAPWDTFVIGCSNGDVLLILENIVEVTFKCESAVVNIVCSPDYERIVLLTEQGQVVLVTQCFEALNDFNIAEITLTEQPLVNVGWGKKETQFHGSEGKHKRVVAEVVGDEDNVDDSINICWRPDSLLFAIGYLSKINNLRSIKIFNRDGILQYISEPLSGIYSDL